MTALTVIAQHAIETKTWWNPYLKGSLIAIFAIGLFVGGAYLLLYTNVGTRLGFLLTVTAFTGFMAILPLFWIANEFVTGPKGRLPGWPIKEVVTDLSESKFEPVRDIETTGRPAESAEAGQIRANLDEHLAADAESPFKRFSEPTDFVVDKTFTSGGGRKWPWFWSKNTKYGAALVCPADEPDILPLAAPPPPECDPDKPAEWMVLVEDLGAQRLPQFVFLGGFWALFALSLLALHRYERDLAGPRPPDGDTGDSDGGGDAPEPSTPTPEPAMA